MYLGPVVAAQQVLDPSPQTSCPRKEKKWGGAHPLQLSLQESLPGSRYSFTFKMLRVRSFYCVNTSCPMDNSLSGRRGPARQTSEKDVLCLHRLGRSSTVHSPDGVSYFLPV